MMTEYEKVCLKWSKMNLETAIDIDYVLSDFKVLFAYHSGKIENDEITYDTTLEVFEGQRVRNFNGDYRTLYEVVNQKDCYQYLLDTIAAKEPLSLDLVKKVHYELAKNTYDETRVKKGEVPGTFKKGFYVVGEYQIGSDPELVEEHLMDLIEQVNEYNGDDPMKAAAYFHLVFERIHPFADVNGRTGRTLLNYYLMTHGRPPVVIREENRKEYVAAFDAFHYDAELAPMEDYLKKETVSTWKHLIKQAEIVRERLSLSELTEQARQNRKMEKQKLECEPDKGLQR